MSSQSAFRASLLDPSRPAPDGLIDPQGRAAGKRFDVYRNNVAVSLREALETGFPIVRKLVGAENFALLANAFLRSHPPENPLLTRYGAALPHFIESFEPARAIGYLADVARLEMAIREAYHAADAPAFDPKFLAALAPEELVQCRLRMAPSTRVLCSAWPVHAIWAYNTQSDAPKPAPGQEDVLVTRPEYDPQVFLLPAGGAAFAQSLANGNKLGVAAEAAAAADAGFDLAETLGLLISSAAMTVPDLGDV